MIGGVNINQGKRLHKTFKKQCKTKYEKYIFNYYMSIFIRKL